ncbi:MAG: hypothetical protein R3F14_44505 [Polyangiaceae bacterium]
MRISIDGSLVLIASALLVSACSSSTPDATGPAPSADAATGATATVETGAPTAMPAESAGPSAGGCDAAQYATWASCVGTVVTLHGKDPGPNLMQHPVLTGPPGMSSTVQLYMDVPGATQVIVLAKSKVSCTGAMSATGTLEAIDMGGSAGKETYKGYSLKDADVKCE